MRLHFPSSTSLQPLVVLESSIVKRTEPGPDLSRVLLLNLPVQDRVRIAKCPVTYNHATN